MYDFTYDYHHPFKHKYSLFLLFGNFLVTRIDLQALTLPPWANLGAGIPSCTTPWQLTICECSHSHYPCYLNIVSIRWNYLKQNIIKFSPFKRFSSFCFLCFNLPLNFLKIEDLKVQRAANFCAFS